jgi:hypothetical protein
MVDVAALLPIGSIAGFLAILVNAIVAWIVLMVVDKVISGNLDMKRSFIMALVALFIVPIAVGFAGLPGIISIYVIPLVVWIILGELLLKATMVQKLKIVVIAFVVYVILNMVGVPGILSTFLPF